MGIHSTLREAAGGRLPGWTRAGEARRDHMIRVGRVLAGWAEALRERAGGSPDDEGARAGGAPDPVRWRAAGMLHDALRGAEEAELHVILGREGAWPVDWSAFRPTDGPPSSGFSDLPSAILHGPAAAVLLFHEGVEDEELLRAIAYHTVGHPGLADLGRALYCADTLEPGRRSRSVWRADLRRRYPEDPTGVCREVVKSKIGYLLERDRPILSGIVRMWNRVQLRP